MSLKREKIKSYIGFAIKSRNIIFGTDSIVASRKVKLILVSDSLSESSLKELNQFAEKKKILIEKLANEEFFELTCKQQVKAIAITDENLASAIKTNLT